MSRAAGPGANPTDDAFFAEPAGAAAGQAVRVRHDAARRAAAPPTIRGWSALFQAQDAGDHAGRQELGPAGRGGAGRQRADENLTMIADSIREAAPACRRGDVRRRALLRRLQGGSRATRWPACEAALRGRRALDRAVRHQWRHAAARGRGDGRAGRAAHPAASGSASTPTTTPRTRSPTAWPRSAPGRGRCRAR